MVLKFEAYIETKWESERFKKELEELKAKHEEATKKQQADIEQIKAKLENTHDQVALLLETLSNIKKYGAKSGTYAEMDFVLRKVGILTNGEIGGDPETGVVVESI